MWPSILVSSWEREFAVEIPLKEEKEEQEEEEEEEEMGMRDYHDIVYKSGKYALSDHLA